MIATLVELEVRLLDGMGREQLLAALAKHGDGLPPDLGGERLNEQPTDRLRMLLLVAKLLDVLRQQRRCGAAG